jgi:uncharacterized protein (DUF302 family)
MGNVNFRREIAGSVEQTVTRISEELQKVGFGILTRIDFDRKIQEKLGKTLPPVVILGACNPALAYEAFRRNTDIASLIPCNAVVREVGAGRVSVELARPSAMMAMLGDPELVALAGDADRTLEKVLAGL